MSEFNVGDRVKVRVGGHVCDDKVGPGSVGTIVYIGKNLVDVSFSPDDAWSYDKAELLKIETETPEIDTTNLDAEAVEKVRKFAESLRRQAPPTANNKYIWITETTYETFEDSLGIRCSDGDYIYLQEDLAIACYIHCDSIIAWRPADVK